METYLTEDETAAIQELPRDTPYVIRHVSQTQFSIARHYGGAKFQGKYYVYNPATDELIRDDVLKFIEKRRKQALADEKSKARASREAEQGNLFDNP